MTLYYYEYFNEGVECIIKSWDMILIRPRVQLYLYSGIKYN